MKKLILLFCIALVSCSDDLPDAPEWCDTYGGMNSGTCDVSSSSVVRSSSSRRSSSSAGQSGSLPSSSSSSEESSSSINMNISVSSSSSVALSSSDGSGVPGKCGGVIDYNPATERCCGSNKFNYSLQFCSGGNAYNKCGGLLEYDPSTELCCGSNKFATSTQFCYNNSKIGNLCGINPQKSYNPDLYECKSGSNGIYLKGGVAYDKTYNAVLIGTQVWMAENLNYNAAGSRCYNDDPANCTIYGRLYDWATAIAIPGCNNTICASQIAAKGVCPTGWHIPSDADGNVLMKFVNPSCTDNNFCEGVATKLKADSPLWNSNGKGTDDYGFSALPNGLVNPSGSFVGVGSSNGWWSSKENNGTEAYTWELSSTGTLMYLSGSPKRNLHGIRCLQD